MISSCLNVKAYASRLQDLCRLRRKKTKRLEISAPFNFKKQDTMLPGISDDEMSILREKAMASRIGVADGHQQRRGGPRPTTPIRGVAPTPAFHNHHPVKGGAASVSVTSSAPSSPTSSVDKETRI